MSDYKEMNVAKGEDNIRQAVILAGGRGTRLRPFTDDHPKPMYKINGIPFIDYLVRQVKSFGISDIILLLGYKAEEIEDYLGDGSSYGVNISYRVTPEDYDTGARIADSISEITGDFLLMYCDNYCPVNFDRLVSDFYYNKAEVQLSVYSNSDGYTKDNICINEDGSIPVYDKKRLMPGLKGVDIGYAIIKKEVLDRFTDVNPDTNFEAVVYPEVIKINGLYGTVTEHRYYSIGSWERIELTKEFFSGVKTVFLDRDGTINERPPKACYVESPQDFKWLPGAMDAIKELKNLGYRIILISNQPGIARGRLSEDTLSKIHEKMQEELYTATGFKIDAIYYCPHNWNEGCECRKPKPGMLYKAQKAFSINLTESILIGDDDRDIEAGMAAGCKCYQVTENESLFSIVKQITEGKETEL